MPNRGPKTNIIYPVIEENGPKFIGHMSFLPLEAWESTYATFAFKGPMCGALSGMLCLMMTSSTRINVIKLLSDILVLLNIKCSQFSLIDQKVYL